MRIVAIILLSATCSHGQVNFGVYTDQKRIDFGVSGIGGVLNSAPAVTFSCWLTLTSTPSVDLSALICTFHSNNGAAFRLTVSTARVLTLHGRSVVGDALQTLSGPILDLNRTYHIAAVNDYANAKQSLYLDGMLVAARAAIWSNTYYTDSSGAMADAIGSQQGSTSISGTLEDVRIYTRALSFREVQEIHARPWTYGGDAVIRICIPPTDTGSTLTGVARNYGNSAAAVGTYLSGPVAAPSKVSMSKPLNMEYP